VSKDYKITPRFACENQCPQDEQFDDEQDEQPELAGALVENELPAPRDPYLPLLTLDIILLVFLDLHFGQTALGFSLRLSVTTSNCFLHLSHSYS